MNNYDNKYKEKIYLNNKNTNPNKYQNTIIVN